MEKKVAPLGLVEGAWGWAPVFQITDHIICPTIKLYFVESWKICSLKDFPLKMQITLWVHFLNQLIL